LNKPEYSNPETAFGLAPFAGLRFCGASKPIVGVASQTSVSSSRSKNPLGTQEYTRVAPGTQGPTDGRLGTPEPLNPALFDVTTAFAAGAKVTVVASLNAPLQGQPMIHRLLGHNESDQVVFHTFFILRTK